MSARNGAFDRFRGIGAVGVVLIHATPFWHSGIPALHASGWVLRILCQAAVPYFFLLSGWMLQARRGGEERASRVVANMTRRILVLYIPWFALFLLVDVWRGSPHDPLSVARRFLGFSDGRLDIQGYHLWFLPSLLWAQILVYGSLRFTRGAWPALLAGGLLWAGLTGLEATGTAFPWGLVPTEGIGVSLLAAALGAALARWSPPVSGWLVLACAPLLLAEQALYDGAIAGGGPARTFLVSRLLAPAALLLWLAGRPDFLGRGWRGRILDSLGRNSTGIYVSHVLFLALLPLERWIPSGFVRENFVRWPVVLGCAWGLSVLFGRSRFPWVRRLVA